MPKHFVYVLKNGADPPRYYTGLTSDITRRLGEHNAGSCTHTARHRPWSVDVVIEFSDERRAAAFERYLKSGSGVAFANRHLRLVQPRVTPMRAVYGYARMSTNADKVWNRAALESGGASPGPGDRALAALLLVHGLVMNGGVHHALESAQTAELRAAAEGYAFFGFDDVATFFRGAAKDAALSIWTDETQMAADLRYAQMIPDDSHLAARFADVFRDRPDQFAPVAIS